MKFNWKSLNTKYEHSDNEQKWKDMLNFVSSVKYLFVFVWMASCNVYYNFQDCIYIALIRILYVKGYFVSSQNWLCILNRYQYISLSEKRIYKFAFKFLLIIHAHLHLQNSVYFELFTSTKKLFAQNYIF